MTEDKVNALGKPSPGRTDFKSWTREGLEQFARMAADENLVLREDNKVLLQQWRAGLMERDRKRTAYLERDRCVALLAKMAMSLGLVVSRSRTDIEGWDADQHGVVYIELPEGQVSWHFHDSEAHLFNGIPDRGLRWDGHDTQTKYKRVALATKRSEPWTNS